MTTAEEPQEYAVEKTVDKLRKLARGGAIGLQQLERHALRGLRAHAREPAQRLDEAGQRRGVLHRARIRTAASCRAAAACRR